jgi:hypothetical protein
MNALTRFRDCNGTPREQHDDFADQTDDTGIGAARYCACNATSKRYNCTFRRQVRRQDLST